MAVHKPLTVLPEQQNMFFLRTVDDGIATIGQEFADAQYVLQKNELKAWILLIASLDEDLRGNDDSTYVFDAIAFADKLGIDSRKARGRLVADIFVRLSHNFIDIRSREDGNGEQDIYHTAFIYKVRYNRKNFSLEIGIPPDLKPYLFALKKGTFISLDVKDILALDTVTSMRVYIFLRGLDRKGIFSVAIEDLRIGIGLTSEYYTDFRQLKHKILEPAAKEIRKHTGFKHFFIEDNGAKGRKATHIRFGFTAESETEDLFLHTAPDLADLIKGKFSPRVQIVIRLAMDEGFNPRYLGNKLDGADDDRIVANFNYVLSLIHKEKKSGKEKQPEVYGRYFLKAVEEDWASSNEQTELMLQKERQRESTQRTERKIRAEQEKQGVIDNAGYCHEAAKEYLTNMKFADLTAYVEHNRKMLNRLAGVKGFDKEKALTRKKCYREYRVLLQFIVGKMITGELKTQDMALF